MIDFEKFEDMVTLKQEDEDGNIALDRGDVLELIERLRQAEKDAARYRWLRNCDTIESKKFVSEAGGWIVGFSVLDGMIDEAINA